MTKEERVNLYRTDLKEYKRLKHKEWYEDNQERYKAERRNKHNKRARMDKGDKAKALGVMLLEYKKNPPKRVSEL